MTGNHLAQKEISKLHVGTRRAEVDRQGDTIVTSKIVLGVLVAIGIFALSATAAQAGSGGVPFPLTSFFVCHVIKGDASGQVVDVGSSIFGNDPTNVELGSGILACVVAKLFPGGSVHIPCPGVGCNEINPNPGNTNSDGLKCYNTSFSRRLGPAPPPRYTVTDNLFGVDPDVQVQPFQYICAPATFNPNP